MVFDQGHRQAGLLVGACVGHDCDADLSSVDMSLSESSLAVCQYGSVSNHSMIMVHYALLNCICKGRYTRSARKDKLEAELTLSTDL